MKVLETNADIRTITIVGGTGFSTQKGPSGEVSKIYPMRPFERVMSRTPSKEKAVDRNPIKKNIMNSLSSSWRL